MGLHIVCWGTYDENVARTSLLHAGAAAAGFRVTHCHAPLWRGAARRDQHMARALARGIGRACLAYPLLAWRYMRLARHDAVLICYPGLLDLLVAWPLARLRGAALIYDGYLPFYEMLVEDRRVLGGLPGRLLRGCEGFLLRRADLVLCDTAAHGDYLAALYRLAQVKRVMVGAEAAHFAPCPPLAPTGAIHVLFYGHFIALQGVDTIIETAALLREQPVHFTLIGDGAEAARTDATIRAAGLERVTRLPGVPYETLRQQMEQAHICLGIFGRGAKAGRVIPNKVFQALACAKPLITRDSPAMRELGELPPQVRLVAAGDAKALAEAILELGAVRPQPLPLSYDEKVIGQQLREACAAIPADAPYGPAFAEAGWVPAPRYSLRRHLVLQQIGALTPGRLLEVGSASGALLYELSARGWDCTGVETSVRAQAVARQVLAGCSVTLMEALPETGLYDCVVALEVLEHIEDDAKALGQWLARIAPGGCLILSVPAHMRLWSISDVRAGHYRRYSRAQLEALLAAHGFTPTYMVCYGWPLSNMLALARRVFQRVKYERVDGYDAKTLAARTAQSGIERRVDAAFFPYYNRCLGRMVFRFFLLLQRLSLRRGWGTGYLLVARRSV